jgi:hypothetical protein
MSVSLSFVLHRHPNDIIILQTILSDNPPKDIASLIMPAPPSPRQVLPLSVILYLDQDGGAETLQVLEKERKVEVYNSKESPSDFILNGLNWLKNNTGQTKALWFRISQCVTHRSFLVSTTILSSVTDI